MSEQLIELGLLQQEERNLIDRLLLLVSDTAVESETLGTAEFRAKLSLFRRQLAQKPESNALVSLTRECLHLCQDYFRRGKKYLLERETEFAEMIEVLREALARLGGESNAFNSKLTSSSDRLGKLTEIEDIRELRRRIAEEVKELNRMVEEKQKQDEASHAKLSRRIQVLQTNLARTREEASLDPLTRVANRGAFDRTIQRWADSHRDSKKSFVLALLDLDDFKKINDSHGHQVGDRVLLCAAQWFGKYVRATDFLARYGGEEFAILASDCRLATAETRFAELLSKIAACAFEYTTDDQNVCSVRFTVSCGVTEFTPTDSVEDLVRRADEALYEAKHNGKNRVVAAKKQRGFWKAIKPFGRNQD